jgi:CysZ protein
MYGPWTIQSKPAASPTSALTPSSPTIQKACAEGSVAEFFKGAADVFRGAGVVMRHRALWPWVAAPAIVALFLLIAIIAGLQVAVHYGTAWVLGLLPESWAILKLPVEVSFFVLFLFAGYFVFVATAALIAAPFNEMLSEAVERETLGLPPSPFSFWRFLRDLLLGVLHALRRAVIYLASMIGLFLIGSLVPIGGPMLALCLGFVVTARFAAYDGYDAVFARLGWRYQQKTEYLGQNRLRTLGLGATVSVLFLVPLLNLLALSWAAAGATLAFHAQKTDETA